jgi:hypothetical protein
VEKRPLPISNEAVSEVARYKNFWEQAEGRRGTGSRYRFRFVCGLPSVSSVEEALRSGFHCSPQTNFGDPVPRVTSTGEFTEEPPGQARAYPLFLERLSGASGVRVIALGENDIDSCRVFDLTDVNEYRASIRGMLDRAELEERRVAGIFC